MISRRISSDHRSGLWAGLKPAKKQKSIEFCAFVVSNPSIASP